jgi:hypothetical protein
MFIIYNKIRNQNRLKLQQLLNKKLRNKNKYKINNNLPPKTDHKLLPKINNKLLSKTDIIKDDNHNITLSNIINTGIIDDIINIRCQIEKTSLVKSVRYYIDNICIGYYQRAYELCKFDTKVVSNGKHIIKIIIRYVNSDIITYKYYVHISNKLPELKINKFITGFVNIRKDNMYVLNITEDNVKLQLKITSLKKQLRELNIHIKYENDDVFNDPDYELLNICDKSSINMDTLKKGKYYIHLRTLRGYNEYKLECNLKSDIEEFPFSLWTPNKHKYAVIVGISDYLYINDLSYCDEDAVEWYTYLKNRNYEIKLLGDFTSDYTPYNLTERATKQNIRECINHLNNVVQPGDHVVFATSGHGSGDGKGSSWLCCLDENNNFIGEYTDSEIAADFKQLTQKGVTVFISCDNCYSGGIIDNVVNSCDNKLICITTTCSKSGFGYDDKEYSHGAWTYSFLCSILNKKYKNKNPKMGDAFNEATKIYKYNNNNKNEPQIGGNLDIILV